MEYTHENGFSEKNLRRGGESATCIIIVFYHNIYDIISYDMIK